MANGTANASRPADALHTALWSSYVDDDNLRRKPNAALTIKALLPVLRDGAEQLPRPLFAIAMANLVSRYSMSAAIPRDVDDLVRRVLGSTVSEFRTANRANGSPLLMLSELYGILDYGWRRLRAPRGAVGARLEFCILRPFEELQREIDPANWLHKCSVFWDDANPASAKASTVLPQTGRKLEGLLTLPGGQNGSRVPVSIAVTETVDSLKAVKRFTITGAPPNTCRGQLRIEKEPGRPGATRIAHEKFARFADGPLAHFPEQTLAYWIQAETLCMLLPH